MNRYESWISAIFLLNFLLGGCSFQNRQVLPSPTFTVPETETAAPTVSATSTTTQNLIQPTLQPTSTPLPTGKLTIWFPPVMRSQISGIVQSFQKDFPEIQLEWISTNSADIQQKLSQHDNGQTDNTEIVYIESSQIGAVVASGGLEDLSQKVNDVTNFPAGVLNSASWQENLYALPLWIDPVVLYFRRDVMSKAGISTDPFSIAKTLDTWDDLLEICQVVKTKTGFPCFDLDRATNDGSLYEAMLLEEGLGYTGVDGSPAINTTANVAMLDQLTQFWKKGMVSDEPTWSQAWDDHLSSKEQPVAILIGPASLAADLQTWIAPGSVGNWGITLAPNSTEGNKYSANLGGGYLGVAKGGKDQEAAWAFISYLTQNLQSQIRLFSESQIIPAYLPACNSREFLRPEPYFSGQVPGEVFRQAAGQISPIVLFTANYGKIHLKVQMAIRESALGILRPEQALNKAQAELTP